MTRCCSTPAGARCGASTTSGTALASRARAGAGPLAGRAPGRADRLRHLELRPGARRGPGRAVRRAADAEHPPRRRRGREPPPCRGRRARDCTSSCSSSRTPSCAAPPAPGSPRSPSSDPDLPRPRESSHDRPLRRHRHRLGRRRRHPHPRARAHRQAGAAARARRLHAARGGELGLQGRLADKRYANAGKWTDAATGKAFTPKQHYYVGGNTKVYGAILFRFREQDFGEIQHVDGVSPAWPIGYGDLEPWYTRAERLYQVHGERGIDPTEPPADAAVPFPGDQPRAADRAAVRRPAAAGLNPFPLPNGILLDEAAPWRSACIRCATCDGYACPTNGKADAAVIAVEPALRYPNVTLLHRRARHPAGDRQHRPDGHRRRRRARRCAPSGTRPTSSWWPAAPSTRRRCCCGRPATSTPTGSATARAQVGRNLMLHNNSSLIAFSQEPNPTKFQKTLGINDFYFGDPDSDFAVPARRDADARQERRDADRAST